MNKLGKFVVAAALSAAAIAAFALPTSEDVQAVIKQGNYAQAETMLQEVVTAKPSSAKAHYLYAEILAHNARFDQASIEARTAKQLDPKIGFTDPSKFTAFEQMLDREQSAKAASRNSAARTAPVSQPSRPVAPAPVERSSGLPGWVWGLGFAIVAFVIYRMVASRNTAPPAVAGGYPANGGYPAQPAAGPGYGNNYANGGYPGAPMGGGVAPARSGMLGAGLAGAGGFAAGMLAEKLMTGGHQQDLGNAGNAQVANNGGLVPGMFDDSRDERAAAQALEDRPMDYGNGNDWGGDAGGGDAGGGSSSSDDGW